MRQFSLTQLLMAVPLVAIMLTLVMSDGCGTRYSMIGSLDFSSDGKQLAVARYDARDACVTLKCYKADVSRTISIVDVQSGSVVDIVERALKPGNQGPAFRLYRQGRQAVAFGAESDSLFVQDFDGTKVTTYSLSARMWRPPLPTLNRYSYHLATSPDRRLLASGSDEGVVLWDLTSGSQSLSLTTAYSSFMGSPFIAISMDGTLIATADFGVRLWKASDGTSVPIKVQSPNMTTALTLRPRLTSLQWRRTKDCLSTTSTETTKKTFCTDGYRRWHFRGTARE